VRTHVAGNTIRLARLRGAACHGVRTGKPERPFEQSNLLTGQTLAKRSMQTLSEGAMHALRTIPIFAARMSQKTQDACAIVSLVHTCKRTRTVRPKGVKYQIYRCIIFSKKGGYHCGGAERRGAADGDGPHGGTAPPWSSHVRFRACVPSRTTSASQPPRTNQACAPRQQEAPAHAGGRDRRPTCAAQVLPHRHAA
jgi:hypothetical protein